MHNRFRELRASEIYCPRCRTAQPVREKLMLVLPHGDLHEYRCRVCGESVGTREAEKEGRLVLPR